MKTLLLLLLTVAQVLGDTNLVSNALSLTVNTNSVLTAPTNFFIVNSNLVNAVVAAGSSSSDKVATNNGIAYGLNLIGPTTNSSLTASRVMVLDSAGRQTNSTVPSATLLFLDATSSIQTQMDLKAPLISPSFTTPSLGVATATSINKWLFTAPTTAATLTAGGDSLTYTMPTTSQTMVGRTSSDTLSNKTLTTPTIADLSNATHTHQNSAGGGTLDAAAIAAGTVAAARMPALTGDVTTSAGAVATTIANSAVTLPKIANASENSKLLGSGASGSGAAYSEITLGTGLSMIGTTLNGSSSGGTSGTMISSGPWATGAVPKASDTTGTNFVSSAITVTGTNATLTGNIAANGATFTNALGVASGGTAATTTYGAIDSLITAETTVASAATCNIGAVNSQLIQITGTTTITNLGTATAGIYRRGRFSGILTLTYNATSLILPGGASITTAANDCFYAYSLGSGNWIVTSYIPAVGYIIPYTATTTPSIRGNTGTTTGIGIESGGGGAVNIIGGGALLAQAFGTEFNIRPPLDLGSGGDMYLGRVSSGRLRLSTTAGGTTIGSIDQGVRVSAKTTSYSVLSTDSHSVLTTTGASGTITFTLPTAVAGMEFWFYNDVAQTMNITAVGSDVFQWNSYTSGAAKTFSTATKGHWCRIYCLKANLWVIDAQSEAWTLDSLARHGNATLVGGTVTVTNGTVTSNTGVFLSPKTAGGTLGTYTYTLSAGTSFTINSSNALDTSVITWKLEELQ